MLMKLNFQDQSIACKSHQCIKMKLCISVHMNNPNDYVSESLSHGILAALTAAKT